MLSQQEDVVFPENTPPDERIGFKIDKTIFQNHIGNEYFSEKDKLYFYIEYTEKVYEEIKETFESLHQKNLEKLPFYTEEKIDDIKILHCREQKKDGKIELLKDTYIKKSDENHVIIVTFSYPKSQFEKYNSEAILAIKSAKHYHLKE